MTAIFFLVRFMDEDPVLKFPFLNSVNRYNLLKLIDHFDSRGLYRSVFLR